MFSYVIVLVSYIIIVDICHKICIGLRKEWGMGGSKESKEVVFVKSNSV